MVDQDAVMAAELEERTGEVVPAALGADMVDAGTAREACLNPEIGQIGDDGAGR